ncbi:hypothetical protein B0H19DRAFT_1055145 [Mycena capillaripes]|nr:hypothetical protein B0H19DRAFT_1055145 [Mycena capillaripes]
MRSRRGPHWGDKYGVPPLAAPAPIIFSGKRRPQQLTLYPQTSFTHLVVPILSQVRGLPFPKAGIWHWLPGKALLQEMHSPAIKALNRAPMRFGLPAHERVLVQRRCVGIRPKCTRSLSVAASGLCQNVSFINKSPHRSPMRFGPPVHEYVRAQRRSVGIGPKCAHSLIPPAHERVHAQRRSVKIGQDFCNLPATKHQGALLCSITSPPPSLSQMRAVRDVDIDAR